MLAYQQGTQSAFDELYRRHSGRVYGFVVNRLKDRAVADDVFQGTFLKLHRSRAQYDPAFPFLPWLFTICKTVMLDLLRAKKRVREDFNPAALESAVAEEPVAPVVLPELGALPEAQRKAIELRYGSDLSFDEIARQLETSPANVRQLVSRGIKKLKGGARR